MPAIFQALNIARPSTGAALTKWIQDFFQISPDQNENFQTQQKLTPKHKTHNFRVL